MAASGSEAVFAPMSPVRLTAATEGRAEGATVVEAEACAQQREDRAREALRRRTSGGQVIAPPARSLDADGQRDVGDICNRGGEVGKAAPEHGPEGALGGGDRQGHGEGGRQRFGPIDGGKDGGATLVAAVEGQHLTDRREGALLRDSDFGGEGPFA